jgi:phosphotriesterase-related protein
VAVVESVRGPIELSSLGQTLMHEHVFVLTSGPHQGGRTAVRIFTEEGVDLSKVIIAHAGDSNDVDYLTELADQGVLLGMDRFGLDLFNPGAERVKTIAALAARGYAASMVLAHDASCFIDWFGGAHDEVRAAAPNWHYEHISDDVLPALLEAGVTQAQIDTMLVENPVRYFTPPAGGAA